MDFSWAGDSDADVAVMLERMTTLTRADGSEPELVPPYIPGWHGPIPEPYDGDAMHWTPEG